MRVPVSTRDDFVGNTVIVHDYQSIESTGVIFIVFLMFLGAWWIRYNVRVQIEAAKRELQESLLGVTAL